MCFFVLCCNVLSYLVLLLALCCVQWCCIGVSCFALLCLVLDNPNNEAEIEKGLMCHCDWRIKCKTLEEVIELSS